MTSLPEGWALVRLGDHFTITSSKRVFQRDWRTVGVPFYRARELAVLGEKGRVDNELFIDREMFDRYRRAFGAPSSGDFLVTGVGTLGKTYVVHPGDEFYFKDGNIIWFKASATVDSFYLNQLYRTPFVLDQVFANSGGSTVGTYTITNAKLTVIPLPPLEEQSAIAAALADADDLIATLERLIAKKQAIKQGMMQQLLTGRTRLPGFEGEWTVTPVGSLARVTGGGTPSTGVSSYWGGGIPWFTPAEISSGGAGLVATSERTITQDGLANSAATLLPEGSVLVTSRASIGNCAVAAVPVATNQGFTSMIPRDRRSTWFLYYWVQQYRAEFESRSAGSTFLEISASKVAAIPLTAPGLPEQQAIGEVLRDADTELDALKSRLAKARAIKAGMMQQLLTGRTRLPVEAAS